jgi:hypothetical protein
MLAFVAGVLFVIAAVLAWVGAGHVVFVALAAAACIAFHFGLTEYWPKYRRTP